MEPDVWLQPKSVHTSISLVYKQSSYGSKIVLISFIMGVKSIFLDEKLHMGVLLAPIIDKYEEID